MEDLGDDRNLKGGKTEKGKEERDRKERGNNSKNTV